MLISLLLPVGSINNGADAIKNSFRVCELDVSKIHHQSVDIPRLELANLNAYCNFFFVLGCFAF